ncbi:hypothetical protein AVEN_174069-1 [Araneus ventricosus]|uniref:Uncharacterized protein n=1 Tax=Araneus ventricosus TaxID=182803 RepID=A0A4Y2C1R6_ARAVE|nr:hypothetical protein AVEN_174069-1 [Araneus ventricosus]
MSLFEATQRHFSGKGFLILSNEKTLEVALQSRNFCTSWKIADPNGFNVPQTHVHGTPPHASVPDAITATEQVEWTWDNSRTERIFGEIGCRTQGRTEGVARVFFIYLFKPRTGRAYPKGCKAFSRPPGKYKMTRLAPVKGAKKGLQKWEMKKKKQDLRVRLVRSAL